MIIGLTGSIGCGKSTAAKIFAEGGAEVISSDEIAHRLFIEDKLVKEEVIERWGREVLDKMGNISRRKIAEIVFQKEEELKWLEDLIHPKINEERENLMKGSKDELWVWEIPLLFEKKLEKMCNYVVCICTSSEVQLERLYAKGYTLPQIELRMKRQMSLQEKMEKSDFIITNDGSIDFLKQQIFYLIKKLYG